MLGISSGASLGAVLAIYFQLAGRAVWTLPAGAFLGAAVVAVLVFAIAARQGRGRVFTSTLLLVGVALMALNVSLTTFVLSVSLASYDVGREVMYWLLGGLEGRTWDHLALGVPAIAVGAAIIAAHGRDLDALLLGEVGAQSVGVDVPRVRMRLVLACALVVGAAVAVAGPIGFVGLLVPHLCGWRWADARRAGAAVVRGRRRVPGDRGRGRDGWRAPRCRSVSSRPRSARRCSWRCSCAGASRWRGHDDAPAGRGRWRRVRLPPARGVP